MNEYTQITLDEWMQWKEDIRRKLSETASNFVYIGYRLKQIRDSGMYDGASDIFEFAMKEYGLSKSTVSRFIAINERYSEGGNSLELKEEYRAFSSSKLAEMLTLSDNDIQMITDRTTIREIRELKDFVKQEAPPTAEKAEARTPLEKCLIDYFRTREEMLNGIMKNLEQEPPEYKEAAEQMNPSGQASHKKGIVFLFLYDWNTGVKYKLLTQPEPISLTWPELLNDVYRVFGACKRPEVWKDFYDIEQAVKATQMVNKEPEQKTASALTDQGLELSVATSQQEQEKGGDTDGGSDEYGNHTGVSDGAGELGTDVESGSTQRGENTVPEHNEGAGATESGGREADNGVSAHGYTLEEIPKERPAAGITEPEEQLPGQMSVVDFSQMLPGNVQTPELAADGGKNTDLQETANTSSTIASQGSTEGHAGLTEAASAGALAAGEEMLDKDWENLWDMFGSDILITSDVWDFYEYDDFINDKIPRSTLDKAYKAAINVAAALERMINGQKYTTQ